MAKPKITQYGIQSGTERTCYAKWSWSKSHTDRFIAIWYYVAGGTVFVGNKEEIDLSEAKQSIYDAPANASQVKFKVIPIARKHTVKKKSVYYWTASYSTLVKITLGGGTNVETPPAPTVSIDRYKLTASYTNLPTTGGGTSIRFYIYDAVANHVLRGITAKIKNRSASCSYNVPANGAYTVRASAFIGNDWLKATAKSSYSDFSSWVYTPPAAPAGFVSYKATSESSVVIDFENVTGATSYTVQYTDDKDYFNANPTAVQSKTVTTGHADITSLTTGKHWYFRVCATNSHGSSGYTKVVRIDLGSKPEPPSVWCYQSYVTPSERTTIYWTHNSVDGSDQQKAQINIRVGGSADTVTLNSSVDHYSITNSSYADGTEVAYRVRTAGFAKTDQGQPAYSTYSPLYKYTVITPTTISLDCDEELNTYPFNIAVAGSPLSHVLGYNLSIVSLSDYDYTDDLGNVRHTSIGDEVFNRYFPAAESDLDFDLTFVDADLENNCDYKVVATVTSIYGEAVSAEAEFSVLLADEEYDIDAEILVDEDSLTASIHPYATDPDTGDLVENIKLAVYRREFNGRLVNILAGEDTYIDNEAEQFVTDPHPSLDFARYRVVAISESTGISTFADIPAYPIGEENIVIQWDEQWSGFDAGVEDETEEPSWGGSMIKIGYDINISEEYTKDSELIKYAGRTDPVSYYGTNMETKSTWSAAIITLDPDLLYQLRRLANYSGDVYVREPSGIGYWANVQVDIQKDQISPVARVSLDVQKVEGGA